MAKLKQIAIEPAGAEGGPPTLWGLCKDGSLWCRMLTPDDKWLRIDGPDVAPAMPLRRKRAAAAEVELPAMRVTGGAAE